MQRGDHERVLTPTKSGRDSRIEQKWQGSTTQPPPTKASGKGQQSISSTKREGKPTSHRKTWTLPAKRENQKTQFGKYPVPSNSGFSQNPTYRFFPIPTHHECRENPSRTVDAKNQYQGKSIKANGQRTSPKYYGRRSIQGGGAAKPTAIRRVLNTKLAKFRGTFLHAREQRFNRVPQPVSLPRQYYGK
ncbi:unnamed protein product [Macrosiphum euphorbiae]|uniref:Uncharacterized protein n=1 Tax=Macrosiphum euphorbiae TaxID=13131 RepID=A0AAV0WVQ3_9HEMI|nr:unnamed protein product [Macrosiphum euphorbiae]